MAMKHKQNISHFLALTLEVIDRCTKEERDFIFQYLQETHFSGLSVTSASSRKETQNSEDSDWLEVKKEDYSPEFLEDLEQRILKSKASKGLSESEMNEKLQGILDKLQKT